jgi:hypothetical protein
MSEKTREFLKPLFRDTARPSGSEFADLIDSFVNKETDGVSVDTDGNLVLTRGVRLGDSDGTAAGGLRFHTNRLQVFTGGAWVDVASGGGGGFQTALPTTPQSAVVRESNVGIGPFAAAPTFRLEVPLGNTGTPKDQVLFGNVVCGNGVAGDGGFAVFCHKAMAVNVNDNFALRQSPNGPVHINAPTNQVIGFRQGGDDIRLGVSKNGNVVVGSESDVPGAPAGSLLQVQGNAHVQGNLNVTGDITIAGQAFKSAPLAWQPPPSDARVKEHVSDLELGLSELRQVRTVRFRYNGRGGTQAGQAGVGVLAQEIEAILPETVRQISIPDDPELDDMRVFDASPLTFVLINAVKELAARVEHLERALAATTAPAASPGLVVA